jgi:hypothetical protein
VLVHPGPFLDLPNSPWLIEGSMIFELFSQGGEEHNLHNLFGYKFSGSAQVIVNSQPEH